eukprot:COSAG06_NODE_2499_length_6756_cov_5.158780_4_plen_278_part_00
MIADFAQYTALYPGANITASTFDDFTPHLIAAAEQGALPMLEKECGDSWIFGPASDPLRLAHVRLFQRHRSACAASASRLDSSSSSSCGVSEAQLRNFTRFLVKDAEHTFGASTWHYGDDKHPGDLPISSGYANQVFYATRARAYHENRSIPSSVRVMENSWIEQRAWGLDYALAALPSESSLAQGIRREIAELVPPVPHPTPTAAGFVRVAQPTELLRSLGGWLDLALDKFGSIARFDDQLTGRSWADHGHPLVSTDQSSSNILPFLQCGRAGYWQ